MTFNEYAEQLGIKLMREDIKFIRNLVLGMSRERRREVLTEYAEIWCKVRDETERSVAAQNSGRFAANVWLREIACGEPQEP